MIDARDPAASSGVNIAGTGRMLTGEASKEINGRIHRKYLSGAAIADARVGPVFAAWDDVTIEITPERVIAWDMEEADRQVFGGALRGIRSICWRRRGERRSARTGLEWLW